jgi:hypothetical protein
MTSQPPEKRVDLKLIRRQSDDMATLGELHISPGPLFLCYTLENAWRGNERGVSCIPAGSYPLRLRTEGGYHQNYAKRFAWHKGMVEVVVHDRTFILFHIGNYHRDTDGCILLGNSHGKDFSGDGALTVWQSEDAYVKTYRHLLQAALGGGKLHVIAAPEKDDA